MPEFKKGGSAYITELIEKAVKDGSRKAIVTGNHEIETAVRIPSEFTLVLDGCHLCMADGVFSNMFVNEQMDTDLGRTPQGTDRNISILGKNHPILDGGNYNGLSEKTQETGIYPEIWRNNLILFTNVDGFEMRDFACHNQRWWALNFIFCRNGKISGIDFKSNDLWVEEDGTLHHGLTRKNGPNRALVKNSDGIDLRMGCHHIEISDITGFTEDDTVALTNLDGKMIRRFAVEGLSEDLCHIQIRNIKTACFCTNVRLLNQGGTKLHDILIDGVEDCSAESPYMDVGRFGVRIGDRHLYGPTHSTKEETYNITIKNVRSRAKAAVSLVGAMENVVMENIVAFDGAETLLDERDI